MEKLLFLTVLLLLALSGCLNIIGEKTQDVSEVAVENVLLDTLWELHSFGPIGAEETALPETKVTLQFGLDDRITGTGGCNRYFASYDIGAGNTLSVGLMGSTQMYCEGSMEQEYQYFKALESASTFIVDQNSLQLFYDDGRGVLNFAVTEN